MREILFGLTMLLLFFTSVYHIVTDINWMNTAEASASSEYIQVVVEPGDTLWRLADLHNEMYQVGIQEMMNWIQEENDLDGPFLYPGQVLKIPNTHK